MSRTSTVILYTLYQYALAVQRTPNATINTLFHQRNVSTAADKWLNKPNVDTLYSRAFLDLSASDLIIDIPHMGDRYWVWPFYVVFGNNVANLGKLQSDPAGKYLVRFDENSTQGIQRMTPGSPYKACISIPTPYAISVVRILVQPIVTKDEVIYPAYLSSETTNIVPSSKALPSTFSEKPKLKPCGFWSSTIYDSNAYFIPKELDRYTFGDRSNFTLMNGTPSRDGDGPFQILIQPSNVVPPANLTSNWLPSPTDGNGFQMIPRFYGPQEAKSNGSYVFPVVETIDPITV